MLCTYKFELNKWTKRHWKPNEKNEALIFVVLITKELMNNYYEI